MSLRFERHQGQAEVDGEFKHLDETKEDRIVFATRVPNASDKGRIWLYYTASAMTIYFKNPISGTWFSEALS